MTIFERILLNWTVPTNNWKTNESPAAEEDRVQAVF